MPQTANLMWYLGASSAWAGITASSRMGLCAPPRAIALSGTPAIMATDPINPACPACFRKSRLSVAILFISPPSLRAVSEIVQRDNLSLRGYWFLQKRCPCAVPTGLRSGFLGFRFPTLKRGANKLCASGAADRTLLMRCSKNPALLLRDWAYGLKPVPFKTERFPILVRIDDKRVYLG